MDALNVWGPTKDFTVIGLGASELDDYARTAAAEQGRTVRPDPEPEKGFYYRSDHFNFAKQGVPAFYAESGVEYVGQPAGYGMQKRAEYTRDLYHKPQDEVDPKWNLLGLREDVMIYFSIGRAVADADRFPEWRAGNEFRAIREKQLRR
jgi:Zn-dependent M28 family amino/carboxypeptidase